MQLFEVIRQHLERHPMHEWCSHLNLMLALQINKELQQGQEVVLVATVCGKYIADSQSAAELL